MYANVLIISTAYRGRTKWRCMAQTHKGNNELVTTWKTPMQQPCPPLKDGIKPWFYSSNFSLCEPVVSSETPNPGRRMCDGCYCRLADRPATSGLFVGSFCRWPWKGNSANCTNWTPAQITGLVFVICAGGKKTCNKCKTQVLQPINRNWSPWISKL